MPDNGNRTRAGLCVLAVNESGPQLKRVSPHRMHALRRSSRSPADEARQLRRPRCHCRTESFPAFGASVKRVLPYACGG